MRIGNKKKNATKGLPWIFKWLVWISRVKVEKGKKKFPRPSAEKQPTCIVA